MLTLGIVICLVWLGVVFGLLERKCNFQYWKIPYLQYWCARLDERLDGLERLSRASVPQQSKRHPRRRRIAAGRHSRHVHLSRRRTGRRRVRLLDYQRRWVTQPEPVHLYKGRASMRPDCLPVTLSPDLALAYRRLAESFRRNDALLANVPGRCQHIFVDELYTPAVPGKDDCREGGKGEPWARHHEWEGQR